MYRNSEPVISKAPSISPIERYLQNLSLEGPKIVPRPPSQVPPPILSQLQGRELLYGFELTEDLIKNYPGFIEWKQSPSYDVSLAAHFGIEEAAENIGLVFPYIRFSIGDFRGKSNDPEASTENIAYFASTITGAVSSSCVAPEVLKRLTDTLKTDIEPRWIVV
ncbi:hypothetical protein VKT23_003817 [Stygiomarasmius scandens]|uniref:Uncharacterized protein n=1 Tax=Marasmiellus scandens TaxID=2682957 RepID=A0ABR1K4S1_9AGAR